MKKILMGVAVLGMAAAFTACDKCADNSCKTVNDSLSTAYGEYVGSMINADFMRFDNHEKSDKEAFLRGMQIVFGADDSKNTQMGMQVALQLSGELAQMKQQGIDVDRVAVMNAFKAAFLNDSVDYGQLSVASDHFRMLYQRAVEEAQGAKAAELAGTGDSDSNVKEGQEFVEKFKAENPGAMTTNTGLTYLVEVEGEAPTPAEDATVVVNYTGKHINGEVFDSTDGRGPAAFNLQGVVPGFREGLMLLGKGGKATLVIPGSLAYGANGSHDGSIKPNETLIFDVELLEIQ